MSRFLKKSRRSQPRLYFGSGERSLWSYKNTRNMHGIIVVSKGVGGGGDSVVALGSTVKGGEGRVVTIYLVYNELMSRCLLFLLSIHVVMIILEWKTQLMKHN